MTTIDSPHQLKTLFDAPPSWLEPWIDEVWAVRPRATPTTALILPDNCMDLVFTDTRCKVVGASTRAYEVAIEANEPVWGVRFKPGILPLLLDLDARAVLDDAFSFEVPGLDDIHSSWLKRLDDGQAQTAILSALEQSRSLNVEQIAMRLGWTARHLQRKLPPMLGYTLKTWCRVNRLRQLAQEPLTTPLAQVAARCGYADQSHMTRECKRLTGHTPLALNARLRR